MVTDFIYDGFRLSDFGYVVVSFDGSKGGEIDTDSQLSFNHAPMMSGKRQPYITSVYEDPLKMEIQISKNICMSAVINTDCPGFIINIAESTCNKVTNRHNLLKKIIKHYNKLTWRNLRRILYRKHRKN